LYSRLKIHASNSNHINLENSPFTKIKRPAINYMCMCIYLIPKETFLL